MGVKQVEKIHVIIKITKKQVQTRTLLQDPLLPKLMSEELRVKE